jgi:hypothetical protein
MLDVEFRLFPLGKYLQITLIVIGVICGRLRIKSSKLLRRHNRVAGSVASDFKQDRSQNNSEKVR